MGVVRLEGAGYGGGCWALALLRGLDQPCEEGVGDGGGGAGVA